MSRIDAVISRVAGLRHGVVRTCDLRDAGVSRESIRRRIGDGTLARLAPGIFLHASHADDASRLRELAVAVARGGAHAVLSHESAAELLGLWRREARTIHVTTCHGGSGRPKDIILHRVSLPLRTDEIAVVSGIPCTAPQLTCLQLGSWATAHQAVYVLREARFRELIDLDEFRRAVREVGPIHGIPVVRTAIDLLLGGSAGTRSVGEDRVLEQLLRLPIPTPLVNVRGAAGLDGVELDFVWPEQQVVLEIDGHQHAFEPAAASDHAVDEALRAADWVVRRSSSIDAWHDPASIAWGIAEVIAARIP